jgi:hypothetical protein
VTCSAVSRRVAVTTTSSMADSAGIGNVVDVNANI